LEVLAGLQEGDLGYLPLVFESAGDRVAVVRPTVKAIARMEVVSFIVCLVYGGKIEDVCETCL
jgi:hypothetical protein